MHKDIGINTCLFSFSNIVIGTLISNFRFDGHSRLFPTQGIQRDSDGVLQCSSMFCFLFYINLKSLIDLSYTMGYGFCTRWWQMKS